MNNLLFVLVRLVHISIFLLAVLNTSGQLNLVPNPGFDQLQNCNITQGVIEGSLNNWYTVNNTPDSYNACATDLGYIVPSNLCGFQTPKSGTGYIGFAVYNSNNVQNIPLEMVGVKLVQPLKPGKKYCMEFWVNPSNETGYFTDCLEAYFSKTPLPPIGPPAIINQIYIPQISNIGKTIPGDTAEWYKIEGSFTANGDEEYFTLGCFKRHEDIDTIKNTPLVQTAWIDNAYYLFEDVRVYVCDENNPSVVVPNVFTPNGDGANDLWTVDVALPLSENAILVIYNRWGAKVFETGNVSNTPWNGKTKNGTAVPAGVYFYVIQDTELIKSGVIDVWY